MTCTCGTELGKSEKDGQKKLCKCGKAWIFTHDKELGNFWQIFVKRYAPEDRPFCAASKLMKKRQSEAQRIGLYERRRKVGRA